MDQDSREQYQHFLLHSNVATDLFEFREQRQAADGEPGRPARRTGCRRSTRSTTRRLHGASYGTYNILWQIERCRELGLPYLYLGYWIEQSRKMAYKATFRPIEGLGAGGWRRL